MPRGEHNEDAGSRGTCSQQAAQGKSKSHQLMPNRNRGCALAPWDNCILCDSKSDRQIQSFKPGMHSFEIIVMGQ